MQCGCIIDGGKICGKRSTGMKKKNGVEHQNAETKRVGYMKMVWNTRMER